MLDFLFSIDSLTDPTFVSNFLTIYGKIILESRIFYNRKLKKYKICLQRIAEIVGKNAKLLKLSQNNECGHN